MITNHYPIRTFLLFVFTSFIGLSSKCVFSQEKIESNYTSEKTKDSFNRIYGLDPLLFNGKIYSYFISTKIIGNQFLNNNNFVEGDIIIKGTKFENLNINYDILNQQLLLKFDDNSGAKQIIIISRAWLDGFSIGEKVFEQISTSELGQRFYQVIECGSVRLLYFWKKELRSSNNSGNFYYYFSPQEREYFVYNNTQFKKYKNNKTFLSTFSYEKRLLLKKYMKQKHINVTKASDLTMKELITYCINL